MILNATLPMWVIRGYTSVSQHAPKAVSASWVIAWATIGLGAATVMLALVAFFGPECWRRHRRPLLDVTVKCEEPDCQITPLEIDPDQPAAVDPSRRRQDAQGGPQLVAQGPALTVQGPAGPYQLENSRFGAQGPQARTASASSRPASGVSSQSADDHSGGQRAQSTSEENRQPTGAYLRLLVTNHGHTAAEWVEARIERLKIYREARLVAMKDFLPTGLYWTHYRSSFLPQLPPHVTRHVDLGYTYCGSHVDFIFDLALNFLPTTNYHRIPYGRYEFDITVSAMNCEPVTRSFSLHYNPWNSDTSHVFRGLIVVQRLDP